MSSEPAKAENPQSEPDREAAATAAKASAKPAGLDIASQIQSVARAETDLARMAGDYSANIDTTLSVIEIIEETLLLKRRQIEEIKARQEALALEYRQLGRILNSANRDLAQQFNDIIKELKSEDAAAAGILSASAAPTPRAAAPEAPAPEAPAPEAPIADKPDTQAAAARGASATIAEALAESAAAGEEPADLDLNPADLPPVPEFLGNGPEDEPLKKDSAGDSGSGSRSWWKHSKKS